VSTSHPLFCVPLITGFGSNCAQRKQKDFTFNLFLSGAGYLSGIALGYGLDWKNCVFGVYPSSGVSRTNKIKNYNRQKI